MFAGRDLNFYFVNIVGVYYVVDVKYFIERMEDIGYSLSKVEIELELGPKYSLKNNRLLVEGGSDLERLATQNSLSVSPLSLYFKNSSGIVVEVGMENGLKVESYYIPMRKSYPTDDVESEIKKIKELIEEANLKDSDDRRKRELKSWENCFSPYEDASDGEHDGETELS